MVSPLLVSARMVFCLVIFAVSLCTMRPTLLYAPVSLGMAALDCLSTEIHQALGNGKSVDGSGEIIAGDTGEAP